MKIKDLRNSGQTYFVGLRPNKSTRAAVVQYLKDNKISVTPTDMDRRLHVTVMYSTTLLRKFMPQGDVFYRAQPKHFSLFPDSENEGKMCLVLELDCKPIVNRHKLIKAAYNATPTFEDYRPHMTFTYDAGDIDPDVLPDFLSEVILTEEYAEDRKRTND